MLHDTYSKWIYIQRYASYLNVLWQKCAHAGAYTEFAREITLSLLLHPFSYA